MSAPHCTRTRSTRSLQPIRLAATSLLVFSLGSLLTACGDDGDTGDTGDTDGSGSSGGVFAEEVDGWFAQVCEPRDDPNPEEFTPAVEPIDQRICTDWQVVHAFEFDTDPREALNDHEPGPDDVYYCWAKELDEGHWAAVVVEEYQLDGDPLTPLEDDGFAPCDA